MNMIIVSDDFPEKNHQSYVFVEQLVIALSDLGVKVCVIAPQSLTKRVFRGTVKLPKYKEYKTKKGNRYEVYRPSYLSAGTVGALQRFYFWSLRKLPIPTDGVLLTESLKVWIFWALWEYNLFTAYVGGRL